MTQKKSNSHSTIHQNEIKKGRQKEENFSQENCLPRNFERTKIPKEIGEELSSHSENAIPSPFSVSPSAIIGRARPMTPTTKKGHQEIGGPRAVSSANAATKTSATSAHLWVMRWSPTERMAAPPVQHHNNCHSGHKGVEGGNRRRSSHRCRSGCGRLKTTGVGKCRRRHLRGHRVATAFVGRQCPRRQSRRCRSGGCGRLATT